MLLLFFFLWDIWFKIPVEPGLTVYRLPLSRLMLLRISMVVTAVVEGLLIKET
jgi:hypothetical protein